VAAGGVLNVVAAENVWGSLAAQLGGVHASVTSLVTDPAADPHEHESSAADARAVAEASVVIVNGAGYDEWMSQILEAGPSSTRSVLTVATLLGKRPGDNPHFWYSVGAVRRVVEAITAQYTALDPADAAYFAAEHGAFLASWQPYLQAVAAVRAKDHGLPVAATESIAVYLAQSVGLDLITPPGFMDAISEGNEPSAESVAAMHDQITSGAARILLVNVQTVTAVTTDIEDVARAHSVPVVGISETIEPPGARFQDWQLRELESLQRALEQRS
jgi:zinc/manganese transport system substrate-binding protein